MKLTTREPATSRANNPVGEYVGQYLERKPLATRVGTMEHAFARQRLGLRLSFCRFGSWRQAQIGPPRLDFRSKSARRTGALQNLAEVRTVHRERAGKGGP